MIEEDKTIKNFYSGQITVFMLMLFMIVSSVLIAQYHSAVYYACRADSERAGRLSVDSLLAGYVKPLKERYQILAFDGGFGEKEFSQEKINGELLDVYKKNIQSSVDKKNIINSTLDESLFTMLIENDWRFLLREITLNRVEFVREDGLETLMKMLKDKNNEASDTLQEERQEAERASQEETSESEEDKEDGENEEKEHVDDPRDIVTDIWNRGILYAACPGEYQISDKECSMGDVSYPESGQEMQGEIDFKDEESIQGMFKKWDNIFDSDNMLKGTVEDAAAVWYMEEVFHNGTTHLKDSSDNYERVLEYEIEYIIAGNEKDEENLKSVLWRLLALRCVMNLSHILLSPEKQMQVTETAGVIGAALVIPYFIGVIAFLLKATWAFAESLSDCRALLRGKKVPIIKSDATWHLSWERMLSLNVNMLDGYEGNEGMTYEDYLKIFLLIQNRNEKYRRMTHLIEKNIRLQNEYSNFYLKNCIYGVQVTFQNEFSVGENYKVQTGLSY